MVSREIALEPPAGKLTPAERAVCQLALAGLGNRAIAHARGVSERTIANQLQSIYGKFHARGRRELARAVASSPLAR
jgi:DNA-binding NarL/FixJ family response regulator